MDDVLNGSYLRSGGIWAELERRKGFARIATIKDHLAKHVTRTFYDQSRAELLQLISRKIAYKERLISQFDTGWTDDLHKRLKSSEAEINTLISFVMAFDQMADFMQKETAGAVDEWYQTKRKNLLLNSLLDAETERAGAWSDAAFKLADDYIKRQLNPSHFANA